MEIQNMQYRPFGQKSDLRVSALGFGCMRLPTLDGDNTKIDEDTATDMLSEAAAAGINYADTAHGYHGGSSERWLGRALSGGLRERLKVATKLPTWAVTSEDDLDRLFEEQLERLRTDHVDVYLLHNLHEGIWPRMQALDVLGWLDGLRADGRVTTVGFSFHGGYACFEEIVDAYDWHMCQVQYNYMNEDVQAGTKGVAYAAARGLAVVAMEPLLGGALAQSPPGVESLWEGRSDTPANVALRWLWNRPEISVVLSGMSTIEQVRQNIESARQGGVGALSEEDLAFIEDIRERLRGFATVPCTKCGYCMPCPEGVDIPGNFQLYNAAEVFGGNQRGLNRNLYRQLSPERRAESCVACGACEEKCPQSIAISEELKKVHAAFA